MCNPAHWECGRARRLISPLPIIGLRPPLSHRLTSGDHPIGPCSIRANTRCATYMAHEPEISPCSIDARTLAVSSDLVNHARFWHQPMPDLRIFPRRTASAPSLPGMRLWIRRAHARLVRTEDLGGTLGVFLAALVDLYDLRRAVSDFLYERGSADSTLVHRICDGRHGNCPSNHRTPKKRQSKRTMRRHHATRIVHSEHGRRGMDRLAGRREGVFLK